MKETQGVRVSYVKHWLVFLVLVGAGVWFLSSRTETKVHLRAVRHPAQNSGAAVPASKTWFFVIRMPEVTQGFPPKMAQRKYDRWIKTLLANGFHPMRLTEVVHRRGRAQALPPKTVVFCFDPGYRQTYDTLAPVFAKYGIPAVWITGKKALRRADTRFLSNHQLNIMEKSGLWDVATEDDSGKFSFRRFGKKWRFEADNFALNADAGFGMRRLNANPNWSEKELLQRLNVELPAEEPVYLTVCQIQDRAWGLAVPQSPEHGNVPVIFDITADPQKRSGEVHWLGTVGRKDYELNVKAGEVEGELWVQFPYDVLANRNVALGFTRDSLTAIERQDDMERILTVVPWSEPLKQLSVNATFRLEGNKITVTVPNELPITVEPLAKRLPLKGGVQLLVYDKVRGVAQAKSVQLTYSPISNSAS